MTDEEIRALRRFRAEQVASNEDLIVALADEALRRGQEIRRLQEQVDVVVRQDVVRSLKPQRERIARLEAALREIGDRAEAVCSDPEFVNVLGQPLCRSCEDVLPRHGDANKDCIGWAGNRARAALESSAATVVEPPA